jgi:Ca-activated chloride channel family protein
VFSFIDLTSVRFESPELLWLLTVPLCLLALWGWQLSRRRADVHHLRVHRKLPLRERFRFFGGLLFWLCVILALASTIVAVARPIARVSLLRTAGVDLVILQDASASMYVEDVTGDRWQRSMRFVRLLGEALSWQEDRIALALFANIAAPQVRLTKDPNTFFFFMDHLDDAPPFRLEDPATWDTNIESGIHWGLRLIDKDEELHGPSANAKMFVLVSDGQVWSGQVRDALNEAKQRGIPLFAVGVGTTAGGIIPNPPPPDEPPKPGVPDAAEDFVLVHSVLDRKSLSEIATAGGGYYFELDRETDREIASTIINAARQRAGSRGVEERTDELYWRFLVVAAGFLLVGILFVRDRAELWIQIVGAAIILFIVSNVVR